MHLRDFRFQFPQLFECTLGFDISALFQGLLTFRRVLFYRVRGLRRTVINTGEHQHNDSETSNSGERNH